MPPAPPPGSFGSSDGRQGRSRAKRVGGGFRGGPRGCSFRGGGSFHGGGSFRGFRGGGLRGGHLGHLGDSVRAGRQDSARLIKRASDTRGRSCASQQSRKGSPGSAS